MLIKTLVVIALVVIVLSLGSALFQLLRGQGGVKMAKALTIRISLSLLLVVFLIVAQAVGWIEPHSLVPPGSGSSTQ